MVKYTCQNCNKVFSRKSGYDRHVNRKKGCTPDDFYKCKVCERRFTLKSDYDRHINKKKPCTKKIGSYRDGKHKCKECGKEFSGYHGLYYHIKNKVCDKGNGVKNVQNIQNNNNISMDGDVKLVKFGNENLSHISNDLYKQILGRGLRSVQEFIEHSNFHPDHPENHNIYIANIRDEYIVFFDGKKWSITDRDELMEDIIYMRSDYLIIKFNELSHEMDPRDVLKFENFMKRRDDDDVLRKIKGELTLQFYNNRYLPQRMRKKMEMLENIKLKEEVHSIATRKGLIKLDRSNKKEVIKTINGLLEGLTEDDIDEVKNIISNI